MASAKRRLTNIRVKEVSLVDEAANLRRFIIFKRKGGPGMGKKSAELLKGEGDKTIDVVKLSAEVKEALTNRGNEVIEKMKIVLEDVEKIEVQKDAGEDVPGSVIEKFEEVAKALPQFANDGDEDFGIAKAVEEIKKAGKKISANRLEKIKDAFSILSGLLEEFNDDSSGGASTEKGASSKSTTGHEGGNNMTTENKETETTKRSPEVAFTVAEADVIKAREVLEQAEESADAGAITKAQEVLSKAEGDLKVAKDAKAEADKAATIAKAEKEAADAAEALKKAKGETDAPQGENAEILKQILAGQQETQTKLDAVTSENADLKKKLDEVAKASNPSNSATDDGAEGVETEKKEKVEIEKGKAGKEFWGSYF